VVFLAFCGYGLEAAREAVEAHLARGGWLGAYLKGKRAYLLDAAPFQALTPLVVEGVGLLARLLRGERVLAFWESEAAFLAWTESPAFRQGHAKHTLPKEAFLGPNRLESYTVVLDSEAG
jgi:hypothetical protein